MKKEILAVGIIALLLTIAFSGCVEEKTVTAEEIKERFLQASKSVTSYKFFLSGTSEMTTIKESASTKEFLENMSGEVDILNKKLKEDINFTNVEDSSEQHLIFYIVNNTPYYGNKTDGNITWSSVGEMPGLWNAYSLMESLATILENGTKQFNNTELKRLSDETVENVDCYILQFTGFKNESTTTTLTGYSYTEYDVKYWIAKDTNLLKKSNLKSTIDQSGIYSFGDANRTITTGEMEIFFNDYNVPLNIELPPEAKNSWM